MGHFFIVVDRDRFNRRFQKKCLQLKVFILEILFQLSKIKKNSKGKSQNHQTIFVCCVLINCVITVKYEARSAGFFIILIIMKSSSVFFSFTYLNIVSFAFWFLSKCLFLWGGHSLNINLFF